jgi:TetR/AcrR family transcriptional regulator
MFSKFLKLEPQKQERILNAAINEFAQKGYKNASTNEIVKEAGISKGLIFHYFKSKKDLYFFLYDYLMEMLSDEFYKKLDLSETDMFKNMRQTALMKLEMFKKHPHIFKFFLTAYVEEDMEVKNDLESRNKVLMANSMQKIYDHIDLSKFKDGIDPHKALNIIVWALEGYGNDKTAQYKNMDETGFSNMISDLDIYLKILQDCFYK